MYYPFIYPYIYTSLLLIQADFAPAFGALPEGLADGPAGQAATAHLQAIGPAATAASPAAVSPSWLLGDNHILCWRIGLLLLVAVRLLLLLWRIAVGWLLLLLVAAAGKDAPTARWWVRLALLRRGRGVGGLLRVVRRRLLLDSAARIGLMLIALAVVHDVVR